MRATRKEHVTVKLVGLKNRAAKLFVREDVDMENAWLQTNASVLLVMEEIIANCH